VLTAVRALKQLGKLDLRVGDAAGGTGILPLSRADVLWARYAEAKIGSSWGKEYRVCPERLVRGAVEAGPDRLEIACVTVRVPADAAAGITRP